MLKIYINNEEVIANQNFTIQKHMLNTPSVVLNNVCPKTWCDSKDYTTNFYHPLDYSKCKIIDEYIVPAEPGETISGTSFTIQDYDSTKLFELTELDGDTTQSGTPTPDSPQPVNVVSGRQEVSVVGKNWFKYNTDELYTTSQNGAYILKVGIDTTYIDISQQDNGYYVNSYNNSGYRWYSVRVKLPKNTDLKFLCGDQTIVGTTNVKIYGFNSLNTGTTGTLISNLTNGTTFNSGNYDYYLLGIYPWQQGKYVKDIQIVNANTTDTSFEEYKGQTYEINLGKNLFDKSTAPVLNMFIGSTTINNNASTRLTYIPIQPNTTYTISKVLSSRFYVATTTAIPSNGLAFTTSVSGNSKTELTITSGANDIYLSVFFYHSSYDTLTPEEILDTLQIEKGSQATTYTSYKTPIELCKIGDYQDRIYKDNGTWYIEKQIKKAILGVDITFASTSGGFYSQSVNDYATSGNTPYCTWYKGISNVGAIGGISDKQIAFNQSSSPYHRLYLKDSTYSSVSTLNSDLSTNKVPIYYVLATPTTTEITDTELISQLESLQLLNGLNNISITSGDLTGEITIHYNYTEEQTINDLLFCGIVKNSGNISLNPRQPHYSTLQVLDFKDFLSSGETLDFVIYQKTILEAIQQVIATIQDYGFVLGNVNILNSNDIIGAYSTKDKTAYDVFNYIADITQSRWTTRLIDENTVAIDFYDPTLMPQGTQIDYTNAYFNDKLIDDMKYSYGTNNYRNKQVMISNQVYSNISQAQTIVANGYQTQFPTEQPIGKINSITSNGIPLTFATFNEKEMGYVADFYYTPGDNYFESDDLRSTGEILIIDYVAIVEGRQVITNASEIERINESTGRKGIIARYETRNDATTSTELQKIGESYIKYKGTPEIILTIQSRKNTWEVGQRVQFNAPIDDLETEYMVRSKKINYIANQQENESQLFYTYELVSSFNSETEINYFDNQRAKSTGNIGEGEYISRNIDIESTAEIIFYETTTTEVVPSGDNELNAILNSPFIS